MKPDDEGATSLVESGRLITWFEVVDPFVARTHDDEPIHDDYSNLYFEAPGGCVLMRESWPDGQAASRPRAGRSQQAIHGPSRCRLQSSDARSASRHIPSSRSLSD